ncbi:MAG: hypothetical protein GY719_23245 [bacterium]|nr:hypothetical protein [bacterium]
MKRWPWELDPRWQGEVEAPSDEECRRRIGHDKWLLLDAIDSELLKDEEITVVMSWHPEWCALMAETGVCNCLPEIEVKGRSGNFLLRSDGTVEPLDVN